MNPITERIYLQAHKQFLEWLPSRHGRPPKSMDWLIAEFIASQEWPAQRKKQINAALRYKSFVKRRRTVQYKSRLSDAEWLDRMVAFSNGMK